MTTSTHKLCFFPRLESSCFQQRSAMAKYTAGKCMVGKRKGKGERGEERRVMEYKLSVTHDHLLPHSPHPHPPLSSSSLPLSLPHLLLPSSFPHHVLAPLPSFLSLLHPSLDLLSTFLPYSPLLPHLSFPIPVSVVKRTQGTTTRTNVLIGLGTS